MAVAGFGTPFKIITNAGMHWKLIASLTGFIKAMIKVHPQIKSKAFPGIINQGRKDIGEVFKGD
jgi:hypothetical protein